MCYNRNMDLYIIILIIRTSFMPDWSSIATIFQSSWAFLTPVYACLRRISENVLKYGLKGPIEQINKSNTSKVGAIRVRGRDAWRHDLQASHQ